MQGRGKNNCFWQHGWIRVILRENIRYRRKYSLFPFTRSWAGKTHTDRKSVLGPLSSGVSLANPSRRRPSQSASPCFLVTTCDPKAVIENADMSEEMQQDSVECAPQALGKYNIEKGTVAHIKKDSPTWRCIGGGISVVMWHMIPNTPSTSTRANWPFSCSNLVKSMDHATHPVIHPKTRTAA